MRSIKKNLFKNIQLLLLDVDGVLTKGEIIYDSTGKESKIFNVKDGLGIYVLKKLGIPTVLVTAKDGAVVRRRAHDMGVAAVFAGLLPKERCLPDLQKQFSVLPEHMCFIGDDLIDITLMNSVGAAVAVADAPALVKQSAHCITAAKGGHGAVREIIDAIIQQQRLMPKLKKLLAQWPS